jgi:hypothetical protein
MVGLIQNPVRRDTDMDTPLGGVLSCPVCPAGHLPTMSGFVWFVRPVPYDAGRTGRPWVQWQIAAICSLTQSSPFRVCWSSDKRDQQALGHI